MHGQVRRVVANRFGVDLRLGATACVYRYLRLAPSHEMPLSTYWMRA
jgi:hypothetical protein